VHFSTAGAAVMIADPVKNEYRESIAQDLYDMARITDNCEHIHMFQRTCVARDITDNHDMDINTAYNALMGTTKHIGSSWTEAPHLEDTLKMLHLVAGGEDKWRERPFMSISCCHVVPPMKFTDEALSCLKVAVEGGMPVLLLSASQSGATAPACLAGAVAQAWAECLGGLIFVNAIKPGTPAILGTWPVVSDLRTGAMSGGSPEQAILSSACAQMGNYFNLPTGTACGMSDAKFPDFQGGAERAYTLSCAATSGANIIYESAGMYASLLGACPESLLMDNDVLGAVLRITHRSQRENPGIRCTQGRLPRQQGALPRLRHDPGSDANRVYLPGTRRPPEPQRMGRTGQTGAAGKGAGAQEGYPGKLLSEPRQRRCRSTDSRTVQNLFTTRSIRSSRDR